MKTVSAWGNGTVYNVRYNIFDAAGTLVQVYDATKDERTDYIPGPNGALARIKRKAGTDSVTFIHADHLGTARAGTSATGALLFEDFHTPFGESLLHPDATDDQGDYTGHIRDRQTGLSYMQARYQDPLIGRFLSIDPVGFLDTGNPNFFNRYAYTFNDPINKWDPNGKSPDDLFTDIAPPEDIPRDGDWTFRADERNSRGGTWVDESGRSASWEGGTKKNPAGHWDVDTPGETARERFSNRGVKITGNAHDYDGPVQKPLAEYASKTAKRTPASFGSKISRTAGRIGRGGLAVGIALLGSSSDLDDLYEETDREFDELEPQFDFPCIEDCSGE